MLLSELSVPLSLNGGLARQVIEKALEIGASVSAQLPMVAY